MHFGVCTPSPHLATLAPFMPAVDPAAEAGLARCRCGEPLEREMERDCGICVDCQCEAAGLSQGVMA